MKFTFKENPITLVGTQVAEGNVLPDAKVVTMDLEEKNVHDFLGKVTVVSLVPSLDTSVCDLQTKGFIQKLGAYENVSLITISEDLPFAQARWCGAADAEHATVVSDYRFHEVGQNYGALINELQLLTRAVIIADEHKVVRYVEYLPEVSHQVDFDAALQVVASLVK